MSDKQKRFYRTKKFYIVLGALCVITILFLITLNSIIMPAYTMYDEGVTVPNITRISLDEAKQTLSSSGLRYEVNERRSNEAFPADYVIDQNPRPSEIVKPDRKIYLTVNIVSNPTVKIPKVTDLSLRNARIQLENAGLDVGSISYESSRFKNTVLHQSVDAGKVVEKGISIDLIVSDGLGEKMVTVPDIIGLKLTQAQQKLRKNGLHIGEIRFKPSKKVPPNVILDYSPKEKKVTEGKTLQLVVSEPFDAKEENESGAVIDSSFAPDGDSANHNK